MPAKVPLAVKPLLSGGMKFEVDWTIEDQTHQIVGHNDTTSLHIDKLNTLKVAMVKRCAVTPPEKRPKRMLMGTIDDVHVYVIEHEGHIQIVASKDQLYI